MTKIIDNWEIGEIVIQLCDDNSIYIFDGEDKVWLNNEDVLDLQSFLNSTYQVHRFKLRDEVG